MLDTKKTGVLIINLGTPDAPEPRAVRKYLTQFLTDKRVIDYPWILKHILVRGLIIPARYKNTTKGYQKLWTKNGSPLKYYGERVVDLVSNALGSDFMVELAMRYQNPSIKAGIDRLILKGVNRLVILPMYPQYASSSVGSVIEEVLSVLVKYNTIIPFSIVPPFFDNKALNDLWAEKAKLLFYEKYDHVLFSFHGLPIRHLIDGCTNGFCQSKVNCCAQLDLNNQHCYSAQCNYTAQTIAKKLDLRPDQFGICFQSRLGREKWIEPYTSDVLERLAKSGKKNILVFSPAFVADCLETVVEIAQEYKEEFIHHGGESLTLVPSLNDDQKWIDIICMLIQSNIPQSN